MCPSMRSVLKFPYAKVHQGSVFAEGGCHRFWRLPSYDREAWRAGRSTACAAARGSVFSAGRPIVFATRNLFDHLVGAQQDRLRYGQTERLGDLEVYGQLKFCRQLNG
jgi:hypothetical protein